MTVGATTFRVGLHGEGPPLLMMAGIGGNIEMWEPLRTELANRVGMTTIAFDVPGTGGSGPPLVPLPLPAVGLMARQVLRSLRIHEVDVIGLSWGGLLAQHVGLAGHHALEPAQVGFVGGAGVAEWHAARAAAHFHAVFAEGFGRFGRLVFENISRALGAEAIGDDGGEQG